LVLLSALLSRIEGLGLEREILLSSLRTLLQLLALGYLLKYLMGLRELHEMLLLLFFMSLFACGVFTERTKNPRLFLPALFAISLSYLLPLLLLLPAGALRAEPHQLIPFGGLLIGNTLNSLSLLYDRAKGEIKNRREEVEAKVALGATLRQALEEVLRQSLRSAMIPKLNWLKSAGIVHIPGVAVGMLVAGASPIEAVLFQAVVLYALLFAGLVGGWAFARVGYREIFRDSFPSFG